MKRLLLPLVICVYVTFPAWGQDAASSVKEFSRADRELLGELYQRAKRPPSEKKERIEFYDSLVKQSTEISARNAAVPETDESHELLWRRVALPAAEHLFQLEPSSRNRESLLMIAERVANNPRRIGHQIHPEKMRAEEVGIRLRNTGSDGELFPSIKTDILDLLNRYPSPEKQGGLDDDEKNRQQYAAVATVSAARLAHEAGLNELFGELVPVIQQEYLAAPGAATLLVSTGHSPMFVAKMITLDGKELTFPDDFRGKFVVLDYWATWCAPCVASLPHIKDLSEQYDPEEVVFVGVSADQSNDKNELESVRQKVHDFVTNGNYDWVHTWSGSWPESASKYGISRIPHVLIIGKDGRIAKFQARGIEEEVLNHLLSQE